MNFFLYIISVFVVFFIAEKYARKKFKIIKREKIHHNGINSFHIWVKRILWITIFFSVVFTSSLFY